MGAKLFAAKIHAVAGAQRIVDLALDIEGASALARSNVLERLYRDVRAGGSHPPSPNTASEAIGQTYLLTPPIMNEDAQRPAANVSAPTSKPSKLRALPSAQIDL
jgi:hypothetical protein